MKLKFELKLELQPVPTILTEEALKWHEHCQLLACQERLLSREFTRLIKMQVLKMGI